MVAIATPMDDDLARLNRDLADTVIAYGAAEERAEIDDKRRRALEAPAPAAASRLAYMAKTGGRVNSGRADLVDAVKNGFADAASLDEDALPEEMRPMEPSEREAYVSRKLEARNEIQKQIAEISKKRDEYVVAEQDRLARGGRGRRLRSAGPRGDPHPGSRQGHRLLSGWRPAAPRRRWPSATLP